MRTFALIAASLTGPLLLSACAPGAAGRHPVCKDELSTQQYGVKWMDELADASQSGKLPMSQVTDIHGQSFEKLGLLKEKRFADYCAHLDDVREKAGF